MNIEKRVAIVTGSSRGIGRAIALRLAADGFRVVINYNNRAIEGEQVVAQIQANGGQAISVQADVSQMIGAQRLFEAAEEHYGGVDVVVNNAGILKLQTVEKAEEQTFRSLFDVNVGGVFHMLKQAASRLQSGGRIINLSTSVIALGLPGYALYAASKSAVETMSFVFGKELRGRNITVNCVAPGPTATDLFLDGKTEDQIKYLAGLSPLERLGNPEDIASTVSFLAGKDGQWVNAQVLRVNGGIV